MNARKLTYGNNADWLAARQGKIGGSTVAALLGLDRYKTPLQVYYDLTGQSGAREENKYTIAGHKLEKIVVEYFSDARPRSTKWTRRANCFRNGTASCNGT